jgi:hypothetical protein
MSRMSENVGASTSRNPKGLQGLYRENFTFTFTSVSIATGYGLEGPVRFSAVQYLSLLHSDQIDYVAHPASYSMGTEGSFPGGKAAGT